jgi:hypothetical protein
LRGHGQDFGSRTLMTIRITRRRCLVQGGTALLLLPLAGCGWFRQRSASDRMVNAPKGPEAPPPTRRPDEMPPPQAAPQPSVQAAPIAPPARR